MTRKKKKQSLVVEPWVNDTNDTNDTADRYRHSATLRVACLPKVGT